MTMQREAEADLLRFAAEELRESGYTVVLEPSPSSLPAMLKDLRPDGIAIGKKPFLFIEVTREGDRDAERIHKLQQAIRGAEDWRLHLILNREVRYAALETPRLEDIRATLGRIRRVADEDIGASLLMCWACLEALSRAIEPRSFARPQAPGRLVERLASAGHIVASEAQFLRSMIQKRNELVHGQLATIVNPEQVEQFIDLLEHLLAAQRQGVH
ncbi:hypothetical protein [Methylocapsa sp. S129]|uniref:hypothetical protein n=1 Tax=Methylocapsa sp. S129 TaxID=1641869 RepID=UPI00131E62C4|nr:hypothetical protein [Methylocapsa sp. S129]